MNTHATEPLCPQQARVGFTLIELLVVIAVISVLAGLLAPAFISAKVKTRMINEMNSARQMMLAWRMYADDYDDRVLPGYRYGFQARDRRGNLLEHPINARYPWRLAPYLAHNFEILYANKNRQLLHQFARNDEGRYTYAASVFPSLGVNSIFVGGDDLVLPPNAKAMEKFGRFCVLRNSGIRRPDRLGVFFSARSEFEEGVVEGFYRVEPPRLTGRIWAEAFREEDAPEKYGFVHPRYRGKAVAGFADGHTEGLDVGQLEDMQYWANPAESPEWNLGNLN